MFKAKIRYRFDFPTDVDFTDDLKMIARKIVIPLIREGMLTNTDINGKRFPDLEESTKISKYRRKGHSRPLFDENELYDAFGFKVSGRNEVKVFIKEIRKKIAYYLQVEGAGKRKKKFKFFGVTDGMEKDASKFMQRKLTKMLK